MDSSGTGSAKSPGLDQSLPPRSWITRFLEARGLSEADGRPLCSYRCNEDEFIALIDTMRAAVPQLRDTRRAPALACAAFCLFASEWWRREYDGGPWKWEPLLAAIGLDGTPPQQLYLPVERGLRFWKRELLAISVGRGFLVTLACEGGLPLRLIDRDGHHLRRYFRALLEEFRIHRRAGRDPEWLAERAGHNLPRSLRQKVVYAISGQLIAQIWDLQAKVGDARDPLGALDGVEPGWRDRLPLRVEDATAEALLKNLVQEASRLAAAEPTRISVARLLKETLSGWRLAAEVDLPGVTPAKDLASLLEKHDESDLDSRLELYALDHSDVPYLLAYASQRVRAGQTEYLLEKPGRAALVLGANVAAGSIRIVATAGSRRTQPKLLPQGEALSSLPWIFVSSSDADVPRFSGQGSGRTRYLEAWVAAPESSSPEPEDGASCNPVGRIKELHRAVYHVTGSVRFRDSEGTFCVVKTGQATEGGPDYQIAGKVERLRGNVPVYSSVPKLWCYDTPQSRPRPIPLAEIEWRPAGQGSWQRGPPQTFGLIDARHVEGGELRFRSRFGFVPSGLSVSWKHGHSYREGAIELGGLDGGRVGWQETPDVNIEIDSRADPETSDVVLHCVADGEPPADLAIVLVWPGGVSLEIFVPFPAKGARFLTSDGRALADGAVVSFRQLTGLRAVASSSRSSDKFVVTGALLAEDASPGLTRSGIWEQVPATDGIFRLDLSYLAEQFAQLFSASSDLDAHVNLRIEYERGATPEYRRLDVRRFDLELEPDRAEGVVRLASQGSEPITLDKAGAFRLEAKALWDPTREPVPLAVISSDPMDPQVQWRVDESLLEPGPWLIVGWEGSWCRFRPLLWTIGAIPEDALDVFCESGAIGDALRVPNPKERRRAIDAALSYLEEDPADPNWGLLSEYFAAFRDLPAPSLDLFGCVAVRPKTAVGLLLRADEAQFDAVWERLEELPFSWHLVPVEAWMQAASSLATHYRDQLVDFGGDVDGLLRQFFSTFAKRVPVKLEPLGHIIELVGSMEIIPGLVDKPGLLSIARSQQGRAHLIKHLSVARQDLLRAQADAEWPQGHQVGNWSGANKDLLTEFQELWLKPPDGVGFRSDVLHAPIIAALASTFNLPVNRDLVCEIKRLRRFDERWFDTAYSVALALAISHMLQG
jgi:hypothetical protein